MDYAQCREKVGHAIRDATSTTGARKKRKHQNRTFGKDVGSAIAGREGFSVHKDWDNPADSSAAKGAKDNDSVRGSISNIVWHFRNTNSLLAPPGQLSDHSGVLPNPGTLAQTRAEGSPMLQYAPNPAVTWASTRTPATKPDQKQDASADAGEEQDDQFLAYIEQVLGPLSPDAPSHDAIG